jgi:polyketide biosynthesis acyl carrier protein
MSSHSQAPITADDPLDRDFILGVIVEKVRLVVPELQQADIGPSAVLSDLGLDSVERHEVVILTIEAIGLDLPLVQLHGPRNIGELATLLHAKLAA